MSQGMCLLGEALDLARQEATALEDGAYDRAVELAERRNAVTGMAWKLFDDSESEQYMAHLTELARMQRYLTELASRAYNDIKAHLQRTRVERRRMQGYHKSVGQALQ
ncbi:MAG: hypothetical protein E7022_06825 [Desulfovibrio desulfuricans]|uniref:hypothetical protein n=1 Tax=uncultured Desulfovibrio sp. TaxID=167968 RepID=UPI002624342B|nr:hypothetical protein [uncultured Desulfovibrio sp.]MBE6442031.1 hypothetical protein [Desulfovibrio desulfuricans]